MKKNTVKVSADVLKIMNMNRHDRRTFAKQNKIPGKIPSIINVSVTTAPKKDEKSI